MFRIAVAGCGAMSPRWVRYAKAREDCEIVALVDPVKEKAEKMLRTQELQVPIYSDLKSALEKENINLVFDVTPPQFHHLTVITALEAGCDVFGEKPISDTLDKAYKMVDAAKRSGRNYFVMQNRRYNPYIIALRNFLAEKPLGEISQISADFLMNPRIPGFRAEMDSPLLSDMAIHTFDSARYIIGKDPVAVYCHEFNPSWSWSKGNANALCVFQLEDGSVFDYRGSWSADGMETPWESEWRIQCAQGCIKWDGNTSLTYQRVRLDPETQKYVHDPIKEIPSVEMKDEGHFACFDEMFESLKNGRAAQTHCQDNIKSVEMVYKAIESARSKKVVQI